MSERPGPVGPWQDASVVSIHAETATAKTFRLRLSRPKTLMAGQHFIIRLTAPDGYTAQRSYSIASPPGDLPEIEMTIERLPEGEVSGFLHDEVGVGDELEVRGPIGGWFVWDGDRPALLVGGGSGIVPLMAMCRHARRFGKPELIRMAVSVRTPSDLYYKDELEDSGVTVVYTRQAPTDSVRPPGRLGRADLAGLLDPDATVYVCGSTGFADAATELVMEIGAPVDRIRVERFGPSG